MLLRLFVKLNRLIGRKKTPSTLPEELLAALNKLAADSYGFPVYTYGQDVPCIPNGLRSVEKFDDLEIVLKYIILIHEKLPNGI